MSLMIPHPTYSLFFNQLLIRKLNLYEIRFAFPVDARVFFGHNP